MRPHTQLYKYLPSPSIPSYLLQQHPAMWPLTQAATASIALPFKVHGTPFTAYAAFIRFFFSFGLLFFYSPRTILSPASYPSARRGLAQSRPLSTDMGRSGASVSQAYTTPFGWLV